VFSVKATSNTLSIENVSFRIYPNPSVDKQINLSYDLGNLGSNSKIVVFSTIGKKVFQTKLTANEERYNKSIYRPFLVVFIC
jgi:hypothetical protein